MGAAETPLGCCLAMPHTLNAVSASVRITTRPNGVLPTVDVVRLRGEGGRLAPLGPSRSLSRRVNGSHHY